MKILEEDPRQKHEKVSAKSIHTDFNEL